MAMTPFLALVLVTWIAPTTYVDGAPLPASEIEGYRLSWSVQNVIQPDATIAGDAVSFDLGDLKGRVCVVLRTVVDGIESDPTEIVCRRVKPGVPETIEIR
jgi:hypothetical protein